MRCRLFPGAGVQPLAQHAPKGGFRRTPSVQRQDRELVRPMASMGQRCRTPEGSPLPPTNRGFVVAKDGFDAGRNVPGALSSLVGAAVKAFEDLRVPDRWHRLEQFGLGLQPLERFASQDILGPRSQRRWLGNLASYNGPIAAASVLPIGPGVLPPTIIQETGYYPWGGSMFGSPRLEEM